MSLYFTGIIGSPSSSTSEISDKKSTSSIEVPELKNISNLFRPFGSFIKFDIQLGRPILAAHVPTGKVAFNACGPEGLCDATRQTVLQNMKDSNEIKYFEDAFTW